MTADIRMGLENELDHLDETTVESWLHRCFENCDPRYDTDWLMGMFELALMQFPDNYEVRAACSKAQTMEAQRLYDEGETQEAVSRLEKLLESDPYCTEAFEMLERFMAGDGAEAPAPPPPEPALAPPPPEPAPVAATPPVSPLPEHHDDELLSFLDDDLNIGIESVLEPDLPRTESGEPAPAVPALTLTPVPQPEPVLAAVAASAEAGPVPTLTLTPATVVTAPAVELTVTPPVAEVTPLAAPEPSLPPPPVAAPVVAEPPPASAQLGPPPMLEPQPTVAAPPVAAPPQPVPQVAAPQPVPQVAAPQVAAPQVAAPPQAAPLQAAPMAPPAAAPLAAAPPAVAPASGGRVNGAFDWRSVVGLPAHAQPTLEPQLEAILPSLTERFSQVGNYRSLVMLLTDLYQRDPSHQGVANNLNSVLNDWASHLEKQGRGPEAGQVAAWSQQLLGARANWAAAVLQRFPAQPPSLPDLSGLSGIAAPGWMNWIGPLRDDPSRFQEAGQALAHDPQGLQSLFRHLAVQHPDQPEHVLNLGWAYSHTGQHALAMVHTQRSLQMRQSARAYQLLQKVYTDLGQPEMAQRVAQQLTQLR